MPDGASQSQDLLPLRSDQLQTELAADQRSERRVIALLARHAKPLVGEIADAGRKAESQQMAERKEVLGEAGSVGVVLLDPQIGLLVEEAVELSAPANTKALSIGVRDLHDSSSPSPW
jgi:hypothetical protein